MLKSKELMGDCKMEWRPNKQRDDECIFGRTEIKPLCDTVWTYDFDKVGLDSVRFWLQHFHLCQVRVWEGTKSFHRTGKSFLICFHFSFLCDLLLSSFLSFPSLLSSLFSSSLISALSVSLVCRRAAKAITERQLAFTCDHCASRYVKLGQNRHLYCCVKPM